MDLSFTKTTQFKGAVRVPGDKSISHRAVMFGALAKGDTHITNFLEGADCLSTISCFQKMGISIENGKDCVTVCGKGLHGLSAPAGILDVGNSGTTMRLLSGILAGQSFASAVTGDASIKKRPMERIMRPLLAMGARITSQGKNGCAPLSIQGAPLKGIRYTSPVASAQVKSCVLLAGLYAEGETSVTEPALSRNHTELMLSAFGARITNAGHTASVLPNPILRGQKIDVPGDISSAAYFIAGALMVPNARVTLKNVGVNPTRDGILRVCKAMGADIRIENEGFSGGEAVADLTVSSSSLHGAVIEGELIPTLIDEIPILAVLAAYADGTTVIRDAQELKIKESNRLNLIAENLRAMGADIRATDDGMIIHGGHPLHGVPIETRQDHRIAMSFAIASLIADGTVTIRDADCAAVSYPEFYRDLAKLKQ